MVNAMTNTKEPERREPPYWTHDTDLFEGNFHYFSRRNEPVLVRGKLHLADETYFGAASEIVPLKEKKGSCTYIHLKAYVLVPDIRVTIGLYQQPKQYADQEPVIGKVIASHEQPKMREQEIGDGQAWYYPADKTLVLWECGLYRHFEDNKPLHHDPNMSGLWTGFETFLTQQFKDATQIATTYADPDYDTKEYQQFLTQRGYTPHPGVKAAWSKNLQRLP